MTAMTKSHTRPLSRRRLLAFYQEEVRLLMLAQAEEWSTVKLQADRLVGVANACQAAGLSREELDRAWNRARRKLHE